MGAGASRQILEEPFPVAPGLSRDLDRLSMVAARILSTPDIYDINNLARPGVCGDYAVFLKKGLEKKLLDFTYADASDGTTGSPLSVVYQNPRRAIEKPEQRQKICKQIAETMLRCIATVVACLASIQVASPSRETAVAGIQQRGGASVQDIAEWLARNGYIASAATAVPTATGEIRLELTDRNNPSSNKPQFTIKLSSTANRHSMYNGTLVASGGVDYPSAGFPRMPEGSMRVEIARPVLVPGTIETLLPLRVMDTTGLPWMVGVLYRDGFTSFSTTAATSRISPFDLWHTLFRLTQNRQVGTIEDRASITAANESFSRIRSLSSADQPAAFLQALRVFVGAAIPGAVLPAAPVAVPGYLQPVQRTYGAFGQLAPSVVAPTAPTAVYDIPIPATKNILDAFKLFRESLPKQSSPAAVRALTLSAKVNADRTIQTGICRDPYWSESNLLRVYPWSTLQFLCVERYEAMSTESSGVFHPDWKAKFIDPLTALYNGAGGIPRLTASPEGSLFLNRLNFSKPTLPVCDEPRVGFREVQNGLQRLQEIYTEHVKRVWEILNALVIVIQDPDTKADVVRLHPAVLRGSSFAYVTEQAAKARDMLATYYVAVEKSYLETVSVLKPAA
ncbi:hypothetical protein EBX31_07250 [bacterium]|nr:hypothetical protein [bacterium]